MALVDADGALEDSRKRGTERTMLVEYFRQVARPVAVAVEATFHWYCLLDLTGPLGIELHLVHPYKTRAIASARIKHDWLDPFLLADLLRQRGRCLRDRLECVGEELRDSRAQAAALYGRVRPSAAQPRSSRVTERFSLSCTRHRSPLATATRQR